MSTKEKDESRPMTEEADFLQIKSINHIHFYVGNAKQAMYYWWKAFGFKPVAYSGLETGNREFASYVLESGNARFVVSAPYSPSSPLASHHMLHGDGVKVIALEVEDAEKAWQATTSRGAKSAWSLREERDDFGIYRTSAIYTYGETLHVFVDRSNYKGVFAPTYRPIKDNGTQSAGLAAIDHIVGNVQLGKMNQWVNFYHQVLGFRQLMHFDDKDISTEYSALMSKVMQNGNGRVKFPINEPAKGLKRSQIDEYLDFYKGAGVQHIAVATNDIMATIAQMRANGVDFLYVPETYYEDVLERVGTIDESIEDLRSMNILVDRDEDGYLLQIFTKPIQDRPTVFFEVIQRKGAKSFGKGNFKALFEAIEREQELRGTL